MVDLHCSICEAAPLGEKFARGDWRYFACPECGHARLTPLPAPQEMAALYDESYFHDSQTGGYDDYLKDESLHRLNARDRLKRLARAGAKAGRLLDVGCAAGLFLDEARSAGWQVAGVDCSAWARHAAAEKFGLSAYSSIAEARAAVEGPFQAITFFQVLEHLGEPGDALREAAESLDERGVLVVETWDRESLVARLCGENWQQITPPSVLHLFSRRSLKRLAEDCGFENVAIRGSGKRVSAGFVGNLLQQKHPRLLKPIGWISSRRWIRDFSVRYALGDLITLTARKRAEIA